MAAKAQNPCGYERSFSRRGPLSPALLVSLLLYQVKHAGRAGYARMLEAFWDDAHRSGLELPREDPVTAQAFSAARHKLDPHVVRKLLHVATDEFTRMHGEDFLWHGRRLLAVDSANRNLRASDGLWRHFGGHTKAHYPQCRVSVLYDVLAELPLDAVAGAYGASDRKQLAEMIDATQRGDVVVMDRGYPSFDLFMMLRESRTDFVARMPIACTFGVVEEFVASGKSEAFVELPAPKHSPLYGIDPIPLRLVRVERRDGSPWILATSLVGDAFSAADIEDAYQRRWRIEEFYKTLVSDYFGQEMFHAKWAGGVRQEIYAQLLFVAITRTLMASAARAADVPYQNLSTKGALLAVGDHITRIVLGSPRQGADQHVRRLLRRIARAIERPRPGRSYPRRSLRPEPRWGLRGRNWKR